PLAPGRAAGAAELRARRALQSRRPAGRHPRARDAAGGGARHVRVVADRGGECIPRRKRPARRAAGAGGPAADRRCDGAGARRMSTFLYLVPIALGLGLVGLGAFLWSLRNGQYEDLDGAAERILLDDEEPISRR